MSAATETVQAEWTARAVVLSDLRKIEDWRKLSGELSTGDRGDAWCLTRCVSARGNGVHCGVRGDVPRLCRDARMRYVVTELEGFATEGGVRPRNNARPGLSVQVLDRLTCHRIVAAWRTEDFHGNYERRRAIVRHRAATRCAELNGTSPPSVVASVGLRETCKNGHAQTAENVYYRTDGRRRCRVCQRRWWKRHNEKRRGV